MRTSTTPTKVATTAPRSVQPAGSVRPGLMCCIQRGARGQRPGRVLTVHWLRASAAVGSGLELVRVPPSKGWGRPAGTARRTAHTRVAGSAPADGHLCTAQFEDTLFVTVVFQLSHTSVGEAHDVGRVVALFIPAWMIWAHGTFYMNLFYTDDLLHRLLSYVYFMAIGTCSSGSCASWMGWARDVS